MRDYKSILKKAWDTRGRTGTVLKNGYRQLESNGKREYEHRSVVEKHIGRPLRAGEQVHHLNGNKLDNRINNLVLMTTFEHQSLHSKRRGFGKDRLGVSPVNKLSRESQHIIRSLRQDGNTISQIANITGVSYPTAWKYSSLKGGE